MQLEKNRHIQIALHLMQNDRSVTSDELAVLTRASTRTIKNDIVLINDVLKKHGAEILSKKSEGYFLRVFDEEEFVKYKNELEIISLYYVRYGGTQYLMRILKTTEILQVLLGSNEYISIDDLAARLFVSRSTIKQELPQVKTYLNSYHLVLDSKPNIGLKVTGKEHHYRMAMLCCIGINVPALQNNIRDISYRRQIESEDYEEIISVVSEVIRHHHYRIKDNSFTGVARYLVIMRSRIQLNYGHIVMDAKTKWELDQFPIQKAVVFDLFERLKRFEGFDVSEDEKYYLIMHLIAYHDYEGSEINEETMGFMYPQIKDQYMKAQEFIRETFGLEDSLTLTQNQLMYNVARIVVRNYFDMLPYSHLNYGNGYEEVKDNPVAINLASYLASYFEEILSCQLNTKDTLYLAHYFDELLYQIEFEHKPMKLVTVSGIGRNYSLNIINHLNYSYGKYIESNTSMEIYETIDLKEENVDLIVVGNVTSSSAFSMVKKRFPFASVDHHNHLEVEMALKNGFQIYDLCEEIASMTKIYLNFEFTGQEDCFRILSYKYGVDETAVNAMISSFNRNEERISYGRFGFVLLMADYYHVHRNCFEIYQLKEPIEWEGGYIVKYILFLSSKMTAKPKLMKAFSFLITSLFEDGALIEKLIDQEERSEVIRQAILKQIRMI